MRITFKRIEILNFKSFDNEVFDFVKQNGLNLICGKNNDIPGQKNGAGKSALLGSLIFSLYGQTQDNIKNANIANKYVNSKEVRVVTYFSVEDKEYKVASGFDKRGGPYCQLYEITNNEEVDITRSTMTETRKYIAQELLHCDLSIFLRTIFLSSDQNYNFFRLKKQEKKEFIEKLFNIQVFGKMYYFIHKDANDTDKLLLSQQNKLVVISKNIEDYQTRLDKYNKEIHEKNERLEMFLDKLKTERSLLQQKEIKTNDKEVSLYQEKLSKLDTGMQQIKVQIDKIKTANQKLEIGIHKLQTTNESRQKTIDKHAELLSKLCTDCQKIFSDYYNIETYQKDIEDNKTKISELKTQKNSNNLKIAAFNEKLAKVSDAIEICRKKIAELTAEQLETAKKMSQLDVQIQHAEKDLATNAAASNPYVELHQSSIVQYEHEKNELKKLEEKYRYLTFAENIVSQDTLRKFIISDFIGLLNNKIKMYLTKFGVKYQVVFDSDMNYTFTCDGKTYEYDNFSSGERARLMIAACFAFRDFMYIRNNFSSNILALDEFIDGAIDSLAIESILQILKDFSVLWKQNIFVISHRKEISNDIFDHIIQVVKTNNISKIDYLE